MLRFAPSPSGDMTITNLRIALLNYLVALQNSEPFMLRIEDTDTANNVEGKENEIQDILGLFKIEYNQVLYQSEHKKFHRRMAVDLLQKKNAFNCFCTKPTTPYNGKCHALKPEEIIDNNAEFVVRLRKPDTNVEFNDLIQGEYTFTPDEIDSFIIMDSDKNPSHNFASGVDDMIADVSIVIRDEAHINDTAKQIAVRHALGYDKAMQYAHLPSILNNNEESSKVKYLLEKGFIPEAICNYLLRIGNTSKQKIFSFDEAKEWFSLADISKEAVHFDIDTLRNINREHLKMLDNKELSRYVGFADDEIGALAKLYLEEVATLKELRAKIAPIFAEKIIASEYKERVEILSKCIKEAPYFDEYSKFIDHLTQQSGLADDILLKPLTLLLSGAENGPELRLLYVHIKNYLLEIVK